SEIEAGELEMRSDHHSVRRYLETVFAWGSGELDVAMPGGSTGHEFFGRYNADLRAIAESGVASAAVVSHGAAIRVWVAAHAQNVAPSFAGENDPANTGSVVVEGWFTEGGTLTGWPDRPAVARERAVAPAAAPTGERL